jgi:small-conductance mechanosensitive channel
MRRFLSRINPTLRGFLIIAAIALVVMMLNLYTALITVGMLARIAFFLAIAFFLFLIWRERRGDIAMWPGRARFVFYGAVVLIVADFAGYYAVGFAGAVDRLAFILILLLSGYALFRVWRDQRTWV